MNRARSERDTSHRPEELAEYAGVLDGSELVLVVSQLTNGGAPARAIDLCQAARSAGKGSRGLDLCEARARFLLGEATEAFARLDRVIAAHPEDCAARFVRSQLLARAGASEAARDELSRLVRVAPDYPGALATLARLTFPGPTYREVLGWLHALLRPGTYLEIGIEHGQSLTLARRASTIVGVDPSPQVPPENLPDHARIFEETSDEFFERRSLGEVTSGKPVDLAFIDGLHAFEQVLSDFASVERWCSPDATIVLHDCLPVAPVAALRERRTSFWVGDCFKALEALLGHRDDLALAVVPAYPSGLVIARHLDPVSRVLIERRGQIEAEQMSRPTPEAPPWPQRYPLIANTPAAVEAFVDGTRRAHA